MWILGLKGLIESTGVNLTWCHCHVHETHNNKSVLVSEVSLQHAKKVVSHSPGLVDFALELVNSVLNLPDGQVMFFEEFKLKTNCEINSARQQAFGAS